MLCSAAVYSSAGCSDLVRLICGNCSTFCSENRTLHEAHMKVHCEFTSAKLNNTTRASWHHRNITMSTLSLAIAEALKASMSDGYN